jgi:hypothetical protein
VRCFVILWIFCWSVRTYRGCLKYLLFISWCGLWISCFYGVFGWFGGWRCTTCKCYSFSNIVNASLCLGFNMPGQEPFAFCFSSPLPDVKYVTLQKSHTNYNIRNSLPPMMQRHMLEEQIPYHHRRENLKMRITTVSSAETDRGRTIFG